MSARLYTQGKIAPILLDDNEDKKLLLREQKGMNFRGLVSPLNLHPAINRWSPG